MLSCDVPEDGPRALPQRQNAPASAQLDDAHTGQYRAGSRYVHGEKRTAGWIVVTQIQCPRGHHIRDGYIGIVEEVLRCSKCNVMLWGLFVTKVHAIYLAEVDTEDVRVIKTHESTVQTLTYLGAGAFPVRGDGKAA